MTNARTPSILHQIKSRGYWEITIRPATFQSDRIAKVIDLQALLESVQVRISGWYFPHLDNKPATIRGDYIQESVEFDTILELFRFSQSGQFFYLAALREDWPERGGMFDSFPADAKPGEVLGIGSAIYRFTHVYDFAAHMAQKLPGNDDLVVEVVAHEIENRRLSVDSPRRLALFGDYRAAIPVFRDARQFPRADILAEPRALAAEALERLFHQFQWRGVTKQTISGWQQEMFGVAK